MRCMAGIGLAVLAVATGGATGGVTGASAAAPGPFDGTYRGEIQGAGGGQCRNFVAALRVKDSLATFRYTDQIIFETAVGADGGIDANLRNVALSGKISGRTFIGTVLGRQCRYTVSLPKQ